jgi:outer membrane protein OmpA-like peptidoglycan-associated protein
MNGHAGLNPYRVLGEDAPLWLPWGLALAGALGAVASAILTIKALPGGLADLSTLQPPWVQTWSPPAATGGDPDTASAQMAATSPQPVAIITADAESTRGADAPLAKAGESDPDQGPTVAPLGKQGPDEATETLSHVADPDLVPDATGELSRPDDSPLELAQGSEQETPAQQADRVAEGDDSGAEASSLAGVDSMTPSQPSPDLDTEEQDRTVQPAGSQDGIQAQDQASACPPLFVVHFDHDGVRPIVDDFARRVVELADWLAARPEVRLVVAGHTDAAGNPAHNLSLSRQRARVMAELLAYAGAPTKQLVVRGYGESRPLSQADDTSHNRRVSFSLIGYEGCPTVQTE